MDLNPEKPIQWESRKVHPLTKRLFLSKSIPDVPLAERLKHFVGAWIKTTQDPKILDIEKDTKSHFIQNLFSQKSLPNNSESERGGIGGTGSKRNVEEEIHQKSSTIIRRVCKQLIPCKKEGCGPKTSDKFEATECIYPILSL